MSDHLNVGAALAPPLRFSQLRNFEPLQTRNDPARGSFPNSLNEIGRESGNVGRASRDALNKNLCDAENRIGEGA
jgi:hypothetical protein